MLVRKDKLFTICYVSNDFFTNLSPTVYFQLIDESTSLMTHIRTKMKQHMSFRHVFFSFFFWYVQGFIYGMVFISSALEGGLVLYFPQFTSVWKKWCIIVKHKFIFLPPLPCEPAQPWLLISSMTLLFLSADS